MKWLYNQYAKDVPPYKGSVPEYPTWFESSVMQWLNENDDVSLEYLNGAFARDKKDGVSRSAGSRRRAAGAKEGSSSGPLLFAQNGRLSPCNGRS